MGKKRRFKSGRFSGALDVIMFLLSLVVTAGFVVFDIAKVKAPKTLDKIWNAIGGGIEKAFDGVTMKLVDKLPAGVGFTVLFALFALLFLLMAIGSYAQAKSILKRGNCVFAAILALILMLAFAALFAESVLVKALAIKWVLLVVVAFFFMQMILKFVTHAHAY